MSLCCKAFPFTLENLDLVQRGKQAVLEEFSLHSVHKGTSKSCTVSALLGGRVNPNHKDTWIVFVFTRENKNERVLLVQPTQTRSLD